MALDLDDIAAAAVEFEMSDDDYQNQVRPIIDQATEHLRAGLPELNDLQLAAVSYYIGGMFSSLRNLPLKQASDTVTETAIGYALGAGKLLGMLD